MHTIYSLLTRLLAWLNQRDATADSEATALCWADLPPYHPAAETHGRRT